MIYTNRQHNLCSIEQTFFTNLGHHASPRHDLGIDLLALLLLVRRNGLKQAVQMLVARVVVLVKRLKARRQVRAHLGRVVVLERRVAEVKLVLFVI